MLFTAFIFGVLGGSLALVIEFFLPGISSLNGTPASVTLPLLIILLSAAGIEEGTRYVLLRQYFFGFLGKKALPWPHILVGSIIFTLGFSSLELALVLRTQGALPLASLGVILVHSLSIPLAFVLTGKLPLSPILSLCIATLLHFSYNLAVLFL